MDIRKLSIEEFKYNLTHQTKVQIHFSIDDVLGNYYEFPDSKKLDFTISKEKTGKIKIDDFSHKYTFICDIDKETDEDIYPNNEYQMSGNRVTVRTLDLNCDFDKIAEQLNDIAQKFLD